MSIIVCFSSRLYAFLYTPQVYIYYTSNKNPCCRPCILSTCIRSKMIPRTPPPLPLSSSLCSGIDLVMEPFFSFLRNEHVWRRRWPRLRCYCHIWKGFFKNVPCSHTVFFFTFIFSFLFTRHDWISPLFSFVLSEMLICFLSILTEKYSIERERPEFNNSHIFILFHVKQKGQYSFKLF